MNQHKLALYRAILAAGTVIGTALASVLFAAPANAAAAPTITFSKGVLSIVGDAANDTFVVGRTPAGVVTLNGSVVVNGAATVSNVTLVRLNGGAGNNILKLDEINGPMPKGEFIGGEGRDTITGGSADDKIVGGGGIDRATGGKGNDTVNLGAGTDQFTWNPGDGSDHVDGGADADTLLINGSPGDDTFDTKVSGGRASIRLITPPFDSVDFGGFEQLKVDTGTGSDQVFVAALPVTAATQVRLILGPATGDDHDNVGVSLSDAGQAVRALGSRTAGISVSGMAVPVLMSGAEKLTIVGGFGADLIDGSRLPAGALDEFTEFGFSNIGPKSFAHDTLIGSAGDDTLINFGDGGDRIEGRGGNDELFGSSGDDQMFGGDGDDFLSGLGGTDVLDGGSGTNVIIP